MTKTMKKKWIAALRSGKYKQGKEKLYVKGSYCCLGVLCRINGLTPAQIIKIKDMSGNINSLLSDYLLKKYGLTSLKQHILANMNDKNMGFAHIAGYIENNL